MPLPLLMGAETEYAVTTFEHNGAAEPGRQAGDFVALARERLPFVLDGHSTNGVFLGNAARFYIDAGLHPEYSTPECASPRELVGHVRAGERLMLNLANEIARRSADIAELAVYRCNVDYGGTESTWAAHESYLHRSHQRAFPSRLIGHLVSRIVHSGGGGFKPLAAGIEFTLSPRVWMLERAISSGSTNARGIFHTKDESLSNGYQRLHVLCGESVCSDTSLLLKVGTTSLVVAAIDAGEIVADEVELHSPLEAIRDIALDPDCSIRVPLKNGERVTAIELQRRYLRRVEGCRERGELPDWAGEICARWSQALDELERRTSWAASHLDWAMKHAMYQQWTGRDVWDGLASGSNLWKRVLTKLEMAAFKKATEAGVVMHRFDLRLVLSPRTPIPDTVALLGRYLQTKGEDWSGLHRFLDLRARLCEIDLRFSQLGERGVFDQLLAAGSTSSALVPPEEIEHAMTQPPASGRARLRGELIQHIYASGGGTSHMSCWSRVWNLSNGAYADFSDPFETEVKWEPCDGVSMPRFPGIHAFVMEPEPFF